MVGGDEAAFERAKPVLLAIGPKVTRIGGNGLACQMKIAVNLLLMVEVIGLRRSGGARREGRRRARHRGRRRSSRASRPRRCSAIAARSSSKGEMPAVPLADVTLQQKDMLLALNLGRRLGRSGAARRRRQRDDERVPRPRHRSPRTSSPRSEVYRRLGGQDMEFRRKTRRQSSAEKFGRALEKAVGRRGRHMERTQTERRRSCIAPTSRTCRRSKA